MLLVEDNPGDVRLTKEALLERTLEHYVHVVWNGVDAMDLRIDSQSKTLLAMPGRNC